LNRVEVAKCTFTADLNSVEPHSKSDRRPNKHAVESVALPYTGPDFSRLHRPLPTPSPLSAPRGHKRPRQNRRFSSSSDEPSTEPTRLSHSFTQTSRPVSPLPEAYSSSNFSEPTNALHEVVAPRPDTPQ
jgi:hypothetical protein